LEFRVRGHFDGSPGLPDAQAARRAIAYVRRCFNAVDAILLIRDMDDQPERRGGLEQARASASSNAKIVIGVAIVERESWILSGFDPENDDEHARLNAESQSLGFNPCLRPQELTACKDDAAKRSPKRVLAALTDGDWDRQRKCWMATSLAVLEARGQGNGLKDYLGEVRDRLVPLITGHERESEIAVTTEITVLNALLASIQKAAEYNQNDTVAPAAVLWTDERREWERLVPRLRTLLPHFLASTAMLTS
jgi:hypothetical protein